MGDKEHKKYMQNRYKQFIDNVDDRHYWQWVAIIP